MARNGEFGFSIRDVDRYNVFLWSMLSNQRRLLRMLNVERWLVVPITPDIIHSILVQSWTWRKKVWYTRLMIEIHNRGKWPEGLDLDFKPGIWASRLKLEKKVDLNFKTRNWGIEFNKNSGPQRIQWSRLELKLYFWSGMSLGLILVNWGGQNLGYMAKFWAKRPGFGSWDWNLG